MVTVHFLEVESKELNCSAHVGETDAVSAVYICKYFQQTDFNFSGTASALHATEFASFSVSVSVSEKFGNGLNRTMNVLAGKTRSGNGSRKFTFYSRFLRRNPVNDGIVQAVVVLSAVGFYAQATAIKP